MKTVQPALDMLNAAQLLSVIAFVVGATAICGYLSGHPTLYT